MAKNCKNLSNRIHLLGIVGFDWSVLVDYVYRFDGSLPLYGIAKFFFGSTLWIEFQKCIFP
jgi:hypothetical protein